MAKLILFEVGSEQHALPALQVEQVLRMVALSPLPHAPPLFEGVVNVRGQLLPVFSFHRWRGLTPSVPLAEHHLLVVNAGGTRAALHVDRVLGLEDLPDDALDKAEGWAPGSAPLAGALKLEKGLVLVHDLSRLLSSLDPDRPADAP
ncbi:MAG TPA: chemotaxis protein CheW [Longimicrobium sp.]|nr:chemotaxis protein CheW [Longimicrobium sp.]